jgi:hypothetical protein
MGLIHSRASKRLAREQAELLRTARIQLQAETLPWYRQPTLWAMIRSFRSR